MNDPHLPPELEREVRRFARDRHLSQDEAMVVLLQAGLEVVPNLAHPPRAKTPAEELIGSFSSDEDAALMDEVVAIAYEGRKASAARKPLG